MTEVVFSSKLVSLMRAKGWHVQQVESHLTSRGIPDLYVETPYGCNWFELKADRRDTYTLSKAERIEVQWRPGQQAWMWRKYEASLKRRPCWTLVMFNDLKVLAIKMDRMFKDNFVVSGNCECIVGTMQELLLDRVLFY